MHFFHDGRADRFANEAIHYKVIIKYFQGYKKSTLHFNAKGQFAFKVQSDSDTNK